MEPAPVSAPCLFVFGGLPGTGKSELASHLAVQVGATYLRIDTIEQAMREAGRVLTGPEGYEAAYAIARDNLHLGLNVVADSVNPIAVTREAWRGVATELHVSFLEIEVICTDRDEHRRRAEIRPAGVQGLRLPTWQEVLDREYEPWDRDRLVIDTAGRTVAESRRELAGRVREYGFAV